VDPDPNSIAQIPTNLSGLLAAEWPMLLLLGILVLCSGLAAATEVAFFSLAPAEVQAFKQKRGLVWQLLQKPQRLLATILIFGNFVNIAIIFMTVMGTARAFSITSWADSPSLPWIKYPLAVVIAFFLILFFGEITPKIYASQNRLNLVRILCVPVAVMHILFFPITAILVATTRFWEKRIKTDSGMASFEDIKHAIDLTSDEESPEAEKEILKGIVDFGSTMVKSVMRSRVDMVAADVSMTLEEVVELINQQGYSRLPVCEDNLDNVLGILYAKDLIPFLTGGADQPEWQTLIRPPYFIPETKKLDSLLDEFKTRRLHIAIVVDEFGGTSGLVTLEDMIEEIFGEIIDEFDEEETVFEQRSEHEFTLDGKMNLDDLIAEMELPSTVFDEVRGTADTLAGLILELHRKIPQQGEVIVYEQFQFTIETVEQNRIRRLRLLVTPQDDRDSEQETE
jgi:putative hemolysin